MSTRELIQMAKAQIEFIKYNKGLKVRALTIRDMPKNWQIFPNTNCLWVNIPYPEDSDVTGCLFRGFKDSVIKGHKHNDNIEIITVLNEKGKLYVITPTWTKTIVFGESVKINMGEPHVCVFLEDNTLLNIIWHPKMEGWNADEFYK